MLLLCVFSSLFLLFLIFYVFFSPRPRVRLKRTTMERATISFCLPFGDLRENVLCAKLLFMFSFVDSFCLQNMFLLDILGICFEGVRDSLLLLICCRCFGVWWRAFFLSNLSLVPAFLGFVLFYVRVFFILGASASFEFCWGLFFVLLIFLILGCCFFAAVWSYWFFNFMSWLVVCASRLRCCHFVVNLRANREGSIYFWRFHNRSVWAKTGTSLREEGFFHTVLASISGMEGPKKL